MASPALAIENSASRVHGSKVLPSLSVNCSECGEPISEKRLAAVPRAKHCVPCLEKMGDVPTVKRFDEYKPNGELVSTTFTKNRRIEAQMRRVNTMTAPDEAFAVAMGDDSHLGRDPHQTTEAAYSMSEAFVDEEEAERKQLLAAAEKHLDTHGELDDNVIQMPMQ